MGNLELYEKVRSVPKEAKKEIQAGRLKGKTDINPMWRIKVLTENFGKCGFGWYVTVVEKWIDEGASGEKTANVRINLYINENDKWSAPIEGIGGSLLIAKETAGLRTDDDAFKKAYTDAISVACKALGIGADVYWDKDPTKYDSNNGADKQTPPQPKQHQNSHKTPPKSNETPKTFQPITREEIVRKWGVKQVEETIAWFERKFACKMQEWDEELTDMAREFLAQKKAKREEDEKRKNTLSQIDCEELPFPVTGD